VKLRAARAATRRRGCRASCLPAHRRPASAASCAAIPLLMH
jgi:hypothetical protein